MKSLALGFAFALVLVGNTVLADEESPSPAALVDSARFTVPPEDAGESSWRQTPTAVRVNMTATLGFGSYTRTVSSPQSESGGALGGELRIHPYSMNGFLFGAGSGGALFGPTVTTVDVGYSFRPVAPRFLKGVTGALYLDVGPSVAWVWPTQTLHHDLGGRAGVAFDLQIYNVTVGVQAVYHGGVPVDATTPSQWESFYTLGARAGIAFDLGRERSWSSAID